MSHWLGVLLLDTRFPRLLGDIGNPETLHRLGIAVRYRRLPGATPERTVERADPALLPLFIAAAQELVHEGAVMISTSCGFLARHQQELAASVAVPVFSSSLLHCRALSSPGILTIHAPSLDAATLAGAGVPLGTPIQGVDPAGHFHRQILGNEASLDPEQARLELVQAALELVTREPGVAQIVLECSNMVPHRQAIAEATGREVHDIVSLLASAWGQAWQCQDGSRSTRETGRDARAQR